MIGVEFLDGEPRTASTIDRELFAVPPVTQAGSKIWVRHQRQANQVVILGCLSCPLAFEKKIRIDRIRFWLLLSTLFHDLLEEP